MDKKLHYVASTVIIKKGGKYLIAKRSEREKAFPSLWTVPGGKLSVDDYASLPKDTPDHWYSVLEKSLAREVREEVGLEIKNIGYLLSLAYLRDDGVPTLVLSFFADWAGGEVKLSGELVDHKWISQDELGQYDFVPGLREEIEMVFKNVGSDWQGRYDDAAGESRLKG